MSAILTSAAHLDFNLREIYCSDSPYGKAFDECTVLGEEAFSEFFVPVENEPVVLCLTPAVEILPPGGYFPRQVIKLISPPCKLLLQVKKLFSKRSYEMHISFILRTTSLG